MVPNGQRKRSVLQFLEMLFCIFPCVKFKKFKTNEAVLTVVIDLENILCWNLVKSALNKEDTTILLLCIPPFLTFLFATSVCDVLVGLCLMPVDYKEYL